MLGKRSITPARALHRILSADESFDRGFFRMKTSRRIWIVAACLAGLVLAYMWLMKTIAPEMEASRFRDPSGEYVAIITYKRWQVPGFSAPGDGGSHPGFIRIEDRQGRNYGKATLPLLWMASDLKWTAGGARLVGVAEWNFASGTCERLEP